MASQIEFKLQGSHNAAILDVEDGMEAVELLGRLSDIFKVPIVGVQSADGVLIPLSVLLKMHSKFDRNSLYVIPQASSPGSKLTSTSRAKVNASTEPLQDIKLSEGDLHELKQGENVLQPPPSVTSSLKNKTDDDRVVFYLVQISSEQTVSQVQVTASQVQSAFILLACLQSVDLHSVVEHFKKDMILSQEKLAATSEATAEIDLFASIDTAVKKLRREAIAEEDGEPVDDDMEMAFEAELSDALKTVYTLFARDQGRGFFKPFLAGLALFSRGSADERLFFSFNLFDSDQDGSLNIDECISFLHATLLVNLLSFTDKHSFDEIQTWASNTSIYAAAQLFSELNIDFSDRSVPVMDHVAFMQNLPLVFKFAPWLRVVTGFSISIPSNLDDDDEWVMVNDNDFKQEGGEPVLDLESAPLPAPLSHKRPKKSDVMSHMLGGPRLLTQVELQYLFVMFQAAAEGDALSIDDFRACLQRLFANMSSVQDVTPDITARLQDDLDALFLAFDVKMNGTVLVHDLAIGLSIVCDADKRQKLFLGFGLFDTDRDGQLTREETHAYIETYLRTVLSTDQISAQVQAKMHALVDQAVELVFSAERQQEDSVSFGEFLHVYEKIHPRIQWMSVLNQLLQVGHTAAADDEAEDEYDDELEPYQAVQAEAEDDTDEDIYTIPLANGYELTVASSGLDTFSFLSERFGLVPPEEIADFFYNAAGENGFLKKTEFLTVVFSLLEEIEGVEAESDVQAQAAAFSVVNLFSMLDFDNDGLASVDHLLAAVYALCAGSRFQKLALVFSCFDKKREHSVTEQEMFALILTLMVTLASVSFEAEDVDRKDLYVALGHTATKAAQRIFEGVKKGAEPRVFFKDFYSMYSNNKDFLPWLDLLGVVYSSDDENEEEDEDDEGGVAFVVPFAPLNSSFNGNVGHRGVEVSKGDVEIFKAVRSSLAGFSADLAEKLFAQFADNNGFIDERGFAGAVAEILKAQGISEGKEELLEFVLTSLFAMFDGDRDGRIDHTDFLSAFMLLLNNSLEERVYLAFEAVDRNRTGYLSREEFSSFLSSFLKVFVGFSQASSDLNYEAMKDSIDKAAAAATNEFWELADTTGDDKISYDEFKVAITKQESSIPWFDLLGELSGGAERVEAVEDEDNEDLMFAVDLYHQPGGQVAESKGALVPYTGDNDDKKKKFNGIVITLRDGEALEVTTSGLGALAVVRSEFQNVSHDMMRQSFANSERGGYVDERTFNHAICNLLPLNEMSSVTRHTVLDVLSSAFSFFDRTRTGKLDTNEFTAAIAMMCDNDDGSLPLAFGLADADEDGLLDADELVSLFLSALPLFMTVNLDALEMDPEACRRVMEDVAKDNADWLFALADTEVSGKISYDELVAFREEQPEFPFFQWLDVFVNLPDYEPGYLEEEVALRDEEKALTASGLLSLDMDEEEYDEDDDSDDEMMMQNEQSDLRYSIPLGQAGDDNILHIRDEHINNFTLLRKCFETVHPDDLRTAFADAVNGAAERTGKRQVLDRIAFHHVIDVLVPENVVAAQDRKLLMFLLDQCYQVFDRNHDGYVDPDEFHRGMHMLLNLDREKVVALAFMMADADNDSFLSRVEFMDFIATFIRVTFAIASPDSIDESIHAKVLQAAADATIHFFERAGESPQDPDSKISLDAFQTVCDTHPVPWLSVLDILLREPEQTAALTQPSAPPAEYNTARRNSNKENQAPSYRNPIRITLTDDGDSIVVYPERLANLKYLRDSLKALPALMIAEVFADEAKSVAEDGTRTLDRVAFDRALQNILDAEGTGGDPQHQMVRVYMTMLFSAFDRNHDGVIDVNEFVTGLHLLVTASPAEKLNLAFMMADADNDGHIDVLELERFFYSMFAILVVVSDADSSLHARSPALFDIISRAAQQKTEELFKMADLNHDNRISFDEFCYVYARHPELMFWLTIFDLEEEAVVEDMHDSIKPIDSDHVEPLVRLTLTSDGAELPVDRQFFTALHQLKQRLHATTDYQSMHALFHSRAQHGCLDSQAFEAVVRTLLPLESDLPLRGYLNSLFVLFDRKNDRVVDVKEFLWGLSFLSAANQHEGLILAFAALDTKGDGKLTMKEMCQHFYAIFCVIFACANAPGDVDEQRMLIERAAREKTEELFREADVNQDHLLSFDEFAEVYTKNPDLMFWLKLFDIDPRAPRADERHYRKKTVLQSDVMEPRVAMQPIDAETVTIPLDEKGMSYLEVSNIDMVKIRYLKEALGHLDGSFLKGIFSRNAESGGLTQSSFRNAVSEIIKVVEARSDTAINTAALELVLGNLFYVFDRNQDLVVDQAEFLSGLYALCNVNVDSRLRLAFSAVDVNNDGYISVSELCNFFYSLFATMVSITDSSQDIPLAVLTKLLENAATIKAQKLFAVADTNQDNELSYEEFEQAYLNYPDQISWLMIFDSGQNIHFPDQDYKQATFGAKVEHPQEEHSNLTSPIHMPGQVMDFNLAPVVESDLTLEDVEDSLALESANEHKLPDEIDLHSKAAQLAEEHLDEAAANEFVDTEPTLSIPLSADGDNIELKYNDFAHVKFMKVSLESLTEEELYATFKNFAIIKTENDEDVEYLDRDGFDAFFGFLLRQSEAAAETKRAESFYAGLEFHIASLYRAFDLDGNGQIEFRELIAGISLLCTATPEKRLELAFNVVDEDGDGVITQVEMTKFFGSFYQLIAGASDAASDIHPSVMKALLQRAAVWKTVEFFKIADTDDDGAITYDEYVDAYKRHPEAISWLDMLNHEFGEPGPKVPTGVPDLLRKPSAPPAEALNDEDSSIAPPKFAPQAGKAPPSSQGAVLDAEGEEVPPAFNPAAGGGNIATQNPFRIELSEQGDALELGVAELSNFVKLRTFLSAFDQNQLLQLFRGYASNDMKLSRIDFRNCIAKMLQVAGMTSIESVSGIMDGLFDVFDQDDNDNVTVNEFLSGFFFLCDVGDANRKLELGFLLIDANNDGHIDREEMRIFLQSLLSLVTAISGQRSNIGNDALDAILQRAAISRTNQFFDVADVNRDDEITLDEYMATHQNNPDLFPWMQLFTIDAADLMKDLLFSDSRTDDPVVSPEDMTIVVNETTGETVTLDAGFFSMVKFMKQRLGSTSTSMLIHIFATHQDSEAGLSPGAFDRAMHQLFQQDEQDPRFVLLSSYLRNLFSMFDTNNDGSVDKAELLNAFMLMCNATSRQKLIWSFLLVDVNNSGDISPHELLNFFSAMFAVILSVSVENADVSVARDLAMSAAEAKVTQFFTVADKNHDGSISFDEYLAVYERHPELIPWMHLFDADDDDSPAVDKSKGAPVINLVLSLQENFHMRLFQEDHENLKFIRELLGTPDVGTLLRTFDAHADSKTSSIGRAGFNKVLMAIIDPSKRELMLHVLLSNFFTRLDRNTDGNIDVMECITGFYMLSAARAGEKLQLAFRLMDGDGDSHAGYNSIFQIFLSMFSALVSLAPHEYQARSDVHVNRMLQVASSELTAEIFSLADSTVSDGLTFEEFMEACMKSNRLERFLSVFDDSFVGENEAEGHELPSQSTMIENDLVLRLGYDDFAQIDVLKEMFSQIDFDDVWDMLDAAQEDEQLDAHGFFQVVDQLLKLTGAREDVVKRLLSNLFVCLNTTTEPTVDVKLFMAALFLFSDQEQLAKLTFMFMVLDAENSKALSAQQLWQLFYVVHVCFACSSDHAASLKSNLAAAAAEKTKAVLQGRTKVHLTRFLNAVVADENLIPWLDVWDAEEK